MEEYLPVLQELTRGGVRFAAIGTWALKVYFPEKMRDYVLHDCDIVLDPDFENVRLAIRVLRTAGWRVSVWGEEVSAAVPADFLRGKYYLRAVKDALNLDLTYECAIAWREMEAEMVELHALPIASVAHVFHLKRKKASEAGDVAPFEELERRLGRTRPETPTLL